MTLHPAAVSDLFGPLSLLHAFLVLFGRPVVSALAVFECLPAVAAALFADLLFVSLPFASLPLLVAVLLSVYLPCFLRLRGAVALFDHSSDHFCDLLPFVVLQKLHPVLAVSGNLPGAFVRLVACLAGASDRLVVGPVVFFRALSAVVPFVCLVLCFCPLVFFADLV